MSTGTASAGQAEGRAAWCLPHQLCAGSREASGRPSWRLGASGSFAHGVSRSVCVPRRAEFLASGTLQSLLVEQVVNGLPGQTGFPRPTALRACRGGGESPGGSEPVRLRRGGMLQSLLSD